MNKQLELGIMLDQSRNAVMNLKTLKRFIDIISTLGYKSLQLYTEDTYEIAGEEYFGYMRGRYTADEIKEIDSYAKDKGIELIPCVQTLAHLGSIFRWKKYGEINDNADILLIDDDRTYELIEKMFKTLNENFTSKRVNIGMDEAHNVGLGRYLEKFGYKDRIEIILKHLNRVSKIAKKYDFELMMWSDMFFRLINNGSYFAVNGGIKQETVDKIKKLIPSNVRIIYWDYYSREESHYDEMIKEHNRLCDNTVFAGGLWSWSGFTPHNEFSIEATNSAFNACEKNGINEAFLTMWKDNGGECSFFSLLPSLLFAIEKAKGNNDINSIKDKFYKLFGIPFDEFMYVDLPDKIGEMTIGYENPSKYMLYNDCFLGILDSTATEGSVEIYKEYTEKLKSLSKYNSQFSYVFATLEKLCDILSIKYSLGIETRRVYQLKNKNELKKLIKKYTQLIGKINLFYELFKNQWYTENKTFGFEVQDIRIGGLIKRLENCKSRLTELEKGKINSIAELEEKQLDYDENESFTKKPVVLNRWEQNVTTSVV